MEHNTYNTTTQILFLGIFIGLIFSYTGLMGFLSGVTLGVLLEKNFGFKIPEQWVHINTNHTLITVTKEWVKLTIQKYL